METLKLILFWITVVVSITVSIAACINDYNRPSAKHRRKKKF